MPRSNLPAADAHERHAVPVGLVHVGLNLEHERGKIVPSDGSIAPMSAECARSAAGSNAAENSVEERLHAEVRERRAEEHRRQLAVAHGLSRSNSSAAPASSSTSSLRVSWQLVLGQQLVQDRGRPSTARCDPFGLLLADSAATAGTRGPARLLRSYTPLKSLARADRPVDRDRCRCPSSLFDLLQQLEGVLRVSRSILLMKVKMGMPRMAHTLNSFARLRSPRPWPRR